MVIYIYIIVLYSYNSYHHSYQLRFPKSWGLPLNHPAMTESIFFLSTQNWWKAPALFLSANKEQTFARQQALVLIGRDAVSTLLCLKRSTWEAVRKIGQKNHVHHQIATVLEDALFLERPNDKKLVLRIPFSCCSEERRKVATPSAIPGWCAYGD